MMKWACTTRMRSGKPVYNFSYVDQIYDGLLAKWRSSVCRIELHAREARRAARLCNRFGTSPIISPPKDWDKWGDLIAHFAQHLVERYGIDEVSQWYFEVWNEPNLDFWAGDPKEQTYYQLYEPRPSIEDRQPAAARRRARNRASRLGRSLHPPQRRESRSRRFCFHSRLRKRLSERRLRHE